MDEQLNELSLLLIKKRKEDALSQEDLAAQLGISAKTISRLEKGDIGNKGPHHAVLVRIAGYVEVPVSKAKVMLFSKVPDSPQPVDAIPATTEDTSIPKLDIEASQLEPTAPIEANNTNDVEPFLPIEPHPQQQKKKGKDYKRLLIYIGAITLVGLLMLVVGIYSANAWAQSRMVTIAGNVSCADNLRIVGVWIAVSNGDSGYAGRYKLNPSGSAVHFTYTMPRGSAYNVHVGCGGSESDWLNMTRTENGSGPVTDDKVHSFICRDTPLRGGYGPCYVTQ